MRFVVLPDLHFSEYSLGSLRQLRDEFYLRLFRTVKKFEPELVFLAGDASNNSHPDEFDGLRTCARRAGIEQLYLANGNHDLWKMSRREVAYYTSNPSPSYYEIEANTEGSKVSKFLVLDTSTPRHRTDTRGIVDPEQLNWLSQQLDNTSSGPVFIIAHHPLNELLQRTRIPDFHITNSSEVLEILEGWNKGPGFYFCGHTHTHKLVRQNNWFLLQLNAPLNSLNFPVIEVNNNEVQISFARIEGGDETARMSRLLALVQYHITGFSPRRDIPEYHKKIMIEW
ncbi:MAG: metallophosphoesterase [Chloroflexi bacterium]|uniref:Metallophosphoesterase n=1 Tax=Candidatus Chlorohelix allophototropha TaxID=3003348 RepID=A0A8T7M657_9CHLR|nr:metallophosphoesterase [Chloroflexota bacterium]WJW69519.1 metallophosphoesterase [Chloroflexota bacterium L227-S17]